MTEFGDHPTVGQLIAALRKFPKDKAVRVTLGDMGRARIFSAEHEVDEDNDVDCISFSCVPMDV